MEVRFKLKYLFTPLDIYTLENLKLQKKGSPTSSCHSDFKLQVGLISSISPGVLDFPFHLGALFLKIFPQAHGQFFSLESGTCKWNHYFSHGSLFTGERNCLCYVKILRSTISLEFRHSCNNTPSSNWLVSSHISWMSFILPGRATLDIRELLAPIRSSQFWFSKTNIYFAPRGLAIPVFNYSS